MQLLGNYSIFMHVYREVVSKQTFLICTYVTLLLTPTTQTTQVVLTAYQQTYELCKHFKLPFTIEVQVG